MHSYTVHQLLYASLETYYAGKVQRKHAIGYKAEWETATLLDYSRENPLYVTVGWYYLSLGGVIYSRMV